jgi:hypothetical protein
MPQTCEATKRKLLLFVVIVCCLVGEPEKIAKNLAAESVALNRAFAEFAGEKAGP